METGPRWDEGGMPVARRTVSSWSAEPGRGGGGGGGGGGAGEDGPTRNTVAPGRAPGRATATARMTPLRAPTTPTHLPRSTLPPLPALPALRPPAPYVAIILDDGSDAATALLTLMDAYGYYLERRRCPSLDTCDATTLARLLRALPVADALTVALPLSADARALQSIGAPGLFGLLTSTLGVASASVTMPFLHMRADALLAHLGVWRSVAAQAARQESEESDETLAEFASIPLAFPAPALTEPLRPAGYPPSHPPLHPPSHPPMYPTSARAPYESYDPNETRPALAATHPPSHPPSHPPLRPTPPPPEAWPIGTAPLDELPAPRTPATPATDGPSAAPSAAPPAHRLTPHLYLIAKTPLPLEDDD